MGMGWLGVLWPRGIAFHMCQHILLDAELHHLPCEA